MKSIISKSFLLLVFTAAILLGCSVRSYAQGGCLTFSSTQNVVYYQLDGPGIDTSIEITNNTDSSILLYGAVVVSGDLDILHLPPQGMGGGITLLPGQSLAIECGIYLLCPPTKAVYTVVIAALPENGTACSFDTLTVYIQFPVTDSITLDVASGANTISIAPYTALAAHRLHIVNSYPDDIFLDSLSISSNIASFGQLGVNTFVFKDSLLAGQANDSAILTLVPTDTGIQDIGLNLYYSYTMQSYTIQDSVTQMSLNGYHFQLGRPLSFRNLIPQQKYDSTLYFVNSTPDSISITEIIFTGDYAPGVPWSFDTLAAGVPIRFHIKLPPAKFIPFTIGALDSGCDPITCSFEVISSYGCGVDTAIYPLSGKVKSGTVCNPSACISTDLSLDFGAVAAGDSVTKSLTLTNETKDTVQVSLALGGSGLNQFTNSGHIINPIIIPAFGNVDVSITFSMPSNAPLNNYSAELIGLESSSDSNFICDTFIVPLTASLFNPASVSNEAAPQSVDFSLIPNPASGEVTIFLPKNENATVEIYDVLGNLVLNQKAMGQYVWSGDTPGGAAASGVYFVRVSRQEADGSIIVSSKRLVFKR